MKVVIEVNLFLLFSIFVMAWIVGGTSLRLFRWAKAEGWRGIESPVLTIICFLMLPFGFYLFNVSVNQQEDEPDAWLIPFFFTLPLLVSYPLAIFRLLRKRTLDYALKGQVQWTSEDILEFLQHRQRGLTLAATSAAFGLCPSVVAFVVLLFVRPLPLVSVGLLFSFSAMQLFLLRSVKHTYSPPNESAAVLKERILIGVIGSVLFIFVMLIGMGGGL